VCGVRAELRQAIERTAESFNLAPAEAVLDRWWGVAVIRANRLSEREQAQVARAKTGDVSGLLGPRRARELGSAVDAALRPGVAGDRARGVREPAGRDPRAGRRPHRATAGEPAPTPRRYDELTDQWTTVYGDGAGLLVYAVVSEYQRVIILRLV
jgi:hypothetical protein